MNQNTLNQSTIDKRIHVFVMPATVLLVTAFFAGCSAQRVVVKKEAQASSRSTRVQELPAYRIQSGDQLDIKFFFNPDLNETVFVRPDGKISLQLMDDIRAAELTPSQLDGVLTRNYAQEITDPFRSVWTWKRRPTEKPPSHNTSSDPKAMQRCRSIKSRSAI